MREQAVKTLKKIAEKGGTVSEKALEQLAFLLLKITDIDMRKQAAKALGEIVRTGKFQSGRALDALRELLLDSSSEARRDLPLMVLDDLIALLLDPSIEEFMRSIIARNLGKIVLTREDFSEKALRGLMAYLGDSNIDKFSYGELITTLEQATKAGAIHSKTAIEHICRISGMAFYNMGDRYYVADERKVYPLENIVA